MLQVTDAQRAEGLRFLLACMTAGGLTYPPTEESFVARLMEWASLPAAAPTLRQALSGKKLTAIMVWQHRRQCKYCHCWFSMHRFFPQFSRVGIGCFHNGRRAIYLMHTPTPVSCQLCCCIQSLSPHTGSYTLHRAVLKETGCTSAYLLLSGTAWRIYKKTEKPSEPMPQACWL